MSNKIARFLGLMLLVLITIVLPVACNHDTIPKDVITSNENYTVSADSVIERHWIARAISGTHLITNYQRTLSDSIPAVIRVRLAINGHDNELHPAEYHYIDLNDTAVATIKACEPDAKRRISAAKTARPKSLSLKVDLSVIKKSLHDKGYFATPTHDTIYAHDYKGVWLTADIEPLNVDFSQCFLHDELRVDAAPGENDVHEITINLTTPPPATIHEWKIVAPSKNYAIYTSEQPIMDAIYNMSIAELEKKHENTGKDLIAGQECYAIALSLAYTAPRQSMETLKGLVRDSIITDGNSVETYSSVVNKMIWAEAAWSVYCATGDKEWLNYSYNIILRNLYDIDNDFFIDNVTGMFHATCPYRTGSISQYYPTWAGISDIVETTPLLANIIMERCYRVIEMMGDEFEINNSYSSRAERIKDAINHRLWDETKSFYCQYLYGGTMNLMSLCADNMGQALCIIWDIAEDDRAETLVNEMPLTNYGVPLTYPINEGIRSELNNAVIPMVQALWNIAAAQNGNIAMLRRGIGAMLRTQALAATCATACSATTGECMPCPLARGNAAGNIAMIYRIITGMNFLPNGIEFDPKVPVCFTGDKTITGFKYRNAVLDITIKGTGNELSKITLDGNALADNFINGDISGHHKVVITMNGIYTGSGKITVNNELNFIPETPLWQWDGFYGTNYNYDDNTGYKILINGEPSYSMRDSVLGVRDTVTFRNYSLIAVNKYGFSYISKPHYIMTSARAYKLADYNPKYVYDQALPSVYHYRPIVIDDDDSWVKVPVTTSEAGDYIIDVLYSNGNGEAELTSPCHLLEVSANGHPQGLLAVPQLGMEQWLRTAYSSRLRVQLLKGSNTIELRLHKPSLSGTTPTAIRLMHLRVVSPHSSQSS